jgi:hypothetical protein
MSEWNNEYSSVTDELREAYRLTHFNVLGPKPFTLKIGAYCRELDELYREVGVSSAAFLTAWNPHSQPTEQKTNEMAQEKLKNSLRIRSIHFVDGIGTDPEGLWPVEPSVFAIGISHNDAISAGRTFGQNAIVWISSNAVPQLELMG